jgi:hypothetical protein
VAPPEPTEYMYELRAVAENISRERGHNSEVYPQDTPLYGVPFEECEVQVTNASNAEVSQIAQEVTNAGNAVNVSGVIIPDASEGVQHRVEDDSNQNVEDADSRDVGVPIGPAWVIPMTQAKSLEDLPSQLDMDWQDSVSLTPTPSLAATRNLNQELEAVASSQVVNPPEVVAVDTFAEVSQIAAEVVMDAAQ